MTEPTQAMREVANRLTVGGTVERKRLRDEQTERIAIAIAEAVAAEREACALIVCPVPQVEEERSCEAIAAAIRARHAS